MSNLVVGIGGIFEFFKAKIPLNSKPTGGNIKSIILLNNSIHGPPVDTG